RWRMQAAVGVLIFLAMVTPSLSQSKRLWVLRAPGEMAEYDPTTFAQKQTVKVPAEALKSPPNLLVNHLGQMLFAASVTLPLEENDPDSGEKVWFWDGRTASTPARGITRTTSTTGSNLAIRELAPAPTLSEDGSHLYWFANQARRLQRDDVDLSTQTNWQAWRTDLTGAGREEIASTSFPDCRCTTGGCEETCPYGKSWVPDHGVAHFFLLTQFVAGQTQPTYKASFRYDESAGKWTATAIDPPLKRILDAADSNTILEAIPDTGCCGWANQSDDRTQLHLRGKTLTIFDEQAAYKNPDYDVSFYTENGKLSPELGFVAMTIAATAGANQPIQLAEEGQANPQESEAIRKALAELPAVEVKSVEDAPQRIVYLPHATLVGWISEKELLVVENHLLVGYNVATGARRKSSIRVEDAAHVFLR
ncbi:MAG: hypothetical protein WB510_16665, partial [Candidatus Sulfotelmatobacter sp.]